MYQFKHYIDQFLQLKGKDRSLSPLHYNEYFGQALRKELERRLQLETPCTSLFQPKARSLALVTFLEPASRAIFQQCMWDAEKLLKNVSGAGIKLEANRNPHVSWQFFGDCNARLLDSLYQGMNKIYQESKSTPLFVDTTPILFKKLDFFPKDSQKGKRPRILAVYPDSESERALKKNHESLMQYLPTGFKGRFQPHLSVARHSNKGTLPQEVFEDLQALFAEKTFSLIPNHFILLRNLDIERDQPVFGVVREGLSENIFDN